MVESRICYDEFSKKIQKLNNKVKVVRVKVNGSLINNFVGHKRENIRRIKELYDVDLVVEQDDSVKDFEVRRVV